MQGCQEGIWPSCARVEFTVDFCGGRSHARTGKTKGGAPAVPRQMVRGRRAARHRQGPRAPSQTTARSLPRHSEVARAVRTIARPLAFDAPTARRAFLFCITCAPNQYATEGPDSAVRASSADVRHLTPARSSRADRTDGQGRRNEAAKISSVARIEACGQRAKQPRCPRASAAR